MKDFVDPVSPVSLDVSNLTVTQTSPAITYLCGQGTSEMMLSMCSLSYCIYISLGAKEGSHHNFEGE